MKILWTVYSIPELAPYAKQEKEKIWRDFYFEILVKKWETWLLGTWLSIAIYLLLLVLNIIQNEYRIIPADSFILFVLSLILGPLFLSIIFFPLLYSLSRPWLREYLKTKWPV